MSTYVFNLVTDVLVCSSKDLTHMREASQCFWQSKGVGLGGLDLFDGDIVQSASWHCRKRMQFSLFSVLLC